MRVRFAAVLALGLAVLTTTAQAAERRLDRTFTVAAGGRLTVEASGADIRVRSTDSEQVVVHALIRGSERKIERMRLEAEQRGNDVLVTAKQPSGWSGWFSFGSWQDSEIEVLVPRSYHVDVSTSGGDLLLERIQGDVSGKTSGGDIRVAEVRGPVKMNTSGGDIVLRMSKDVSAALYASTGGGSVRSELPVTTSEFSSRKLVGTLNGGGEQIQARTSGGSIRLQSRDSK